jgi:energy-coupling factor transport system permease protein
VLVGVGGVCVGVYGLLDATTPRGLGGPFLVGGVVVAALGMRLAGRRVRRTVYRPDPWHTPEWIVLACGAAAPIAMFVAGGVDPDDLYPSVQTLRFPTIGLFPLVGGAIAVLPAWLSPQLRMRGDRAPADAAVTA